MTQIDIYSGFLGAGKTTLIKKLIADGYAGQKIVLIENEFGEIGIDGGFLKDAGINITEMNSTQPRRTRPRALPFSQSRSSALSWRRMSRYSHREVIMR